MSSNIDNDNDDGWERTTATEVWMEHESYRDWLESQMNPEPQMMREPDGGWLQTHDDDDIVVVSSANDVVDVTGLACPICFVDFKDGQEIAMFGCDFKHFICPPCARNWDVGNPCHMCRAPVDRLHMFKGQVFSKGQGTSEDPVTISD